MPDWLHALLLQQQHQVSAIFYLPLSDWQKKNTKRRKKLTHYDTKPPNTDALHAVKKIEIFK